MFHKGSWVVALLGSPYSLGVQDHRHQHQHQQHHQHQQLKFPFWIYSILVNPRIPKARKERLSIVFGYSTMAYLNIIVFYNYSCIISASLNGLLYLSIHHSPLPAFRCTCFSRKQNDLLINTLHVFCISRVHHMLWVYHYFLVWIQWMLT